MSDVLYQPGLQNSPYGIDAANPQGSRFNNDAVTGTTSETILLEKEVKRAIFESAPEQYNALRILFSMSPEVKGSDEFEYLEMTFARNALAIDANAAAVAASAGAQVTQTWTLTAASMSYVTPDLVLTLPDNTEVVVKSVNAGANQITVGSLTGQGISAVTSGDSLALRSSIYADGKDSFETYHRSETITRYNYVQFFLRAKRWDSIELQKYMNTGRTDYLVKDKKQKIEQLRYDLLISYFNGHRGQYLISGDYSAKSMNGVFPTMVNAGSANAAPTLAGLQTAFESLAFATNAKKEGAVRFLYGTNESLYQLSKIYKQPGLRYEPNDEIAKLDLKMIEFGTMKFVMVPVELFGEPSAFPSDWATRILCLDQETIRPVIMKGFPQMSTGGTLDRTGDKGTRENFKEWWCEAQLSIEFNRPLGCFWLDIQY